MEDTPSRDLTCEIPGGDSGAPPTKKLRMSATVAGIDQTGAMFSPFTNIPFDVLFEICQYLRPGDIVNLCDASPLCWRMLCTKSAAFIWVNSRELDGLYDIPDGMTEYYWAKLFYSTRCMECVTGKARPPDFYIRKRLCEDCLTAKYKITQETFNAHVGRDVTVTVEVLDYIPSARLHYYSVKKYCEEDITKELTTLSALNKDVDTGKRDAYRKLQRYKASRSRFLMVMQAEAEYFKVCYERVEARGLRAREEKAIRRRYQEVKQRFLDLGYHLDDVPGGMQYHQLLRNPDELTDERWGAIRDEFEPTFQAKKEVREQRERELLMLNRRTLLDNAYAEHKLTSVAPSLWKSLPQLHHLMSLQPFHDLLECDKDQTVTEDDFVSLLGNLEEIVGLAYEEAQTRLRNQVLRSRMSLYSDLTTTEKFQNLELATLVFRCTHCRLILFAWGELKSHYCVNAGLVVTAGRVKLAKHGAVSVEDFDADFPYTFEFCKEGGEAVLLILNVLGLKAADATPSKLDASDTRFLCVHKGNNSSSAFTWRGLVTHLLSHHRRKVQDKTMPPPKKITTRNRRHDVDQVKRINDKIINDYALWACAKCDTHLASGKLARPAEVQAHLKDHHTTEQPQEGVDYADLSDYRLFSALAKGVNPDRYDLDDN